MLNVSTFFVFNNNAICDVISTGEQELSSKKEAQYACVIPNYKYIDVFSM